MTFLSVGHPNSTMDSSHAEISFGNFCKDGEKNITFHPHCKLAI